MAIKLPPNQFDSELELTVGPTPDNLQGTDGNDKFIGTFHTGSTSGLNTANPGDVLNGLGGGKDTFVLTVSGSGEDDEELPGMEISNIEILELRNGADDFEFYGDFVTGLQTVYFNSHTGGTSDLNNMSDEFDMAFSGGSLDDTHEVEIDFVGNAWSGMDDTMELLFKNSNVELDVDVQGFFANEGGVEKVLLKSKGGVFNEVEFEDFDGLNTLVVKGDTDLYLTTDHDNMFSKINMKKMKGDTDLMGDGGEWMHYHHDGDGGYSYPGVMLVNNSEGGPAKVIGGKGDDDMVFQGSNYLNGSGTDADAVINAKKGDDDVDAYNFDQLTVKLGGGDNYADVWDVNDAVIKGGNGMDDIVVDAYRTVVVDSKDAPEAPEGPAPSDYYYYGDYIDAYAGGYIPNVADADAEADPVLTITSGSGMDDIEADTGNYGNALIASGGGDDFIDVEGVEGFVDIKSQGNDDVILVAGRGISEGDMINGGNGMDVLVAGGEDPSELALYGFSNGFNVLNSEDSFAGVSNIETVVILDDHYSDDSPALFDGELSGANDTDNGEGNPAGISHYVLGDYYGISDSYDLDNMIDGVTLDVNVMGSGYLSAGGGIEYFGLDLEGSGGEANINLISSAYHGDPTFFHDVEIEDTEVLNIGLEHVGEDGPEVTATDVPGIVVFGNALDEGIFYGDEALEEVNVSGDLQFGSGIAAGSLETFDGSEMTGTAILGFFDVADSGVEIDTGSGNDIVLGLDEGATFEISTGDGVDIAAIMHGEDQDDVINTGDGNDLAFAGWGNDEINTGGGNDIAIFIEEDTNDADVFNGGSGTDTAVLMSDGGLPLPTAIGEPGAPNQSQFMAQWTSVENVVLGEDTDFLFVNSIASNAGLELLDISMGGEDEIEVGSGFNNDELTVLLSNETFLSHPLIDAHTPLIADVDAGFGFNDELQQFGLNVFSYNAEGVYVDSEAADIDLTVSGIATTFSDRNELMAGDGANDELVVIADDMGNGEDEVDLEALFGGTYWPVFEPYFEENWDEGASVAIFGEYTTGFESLTVLHDVDNDVGVFMDDANVAAGMVFEVDATDLVAMVAPADIEGGEDHDAGDFYFDGGAEMDGSFDVEGGEGNDLLIGSYNNDLLNGNDGDDVIVGGFGGNDTLNGGDGDDILNGGEGEGDDTLDGGAGEDELTGGLGSDELTGGDDADTFFYNALEDSNGAIEDGNVDTIIDFSSAEGDKIDLSGIDTGGDTLVWKNTYGSLAQAEAAINGAAIGDGNLEVLYLSDGTDHSVFVNLNDNGTIDDGDLQIDMNGLASLSGTDFILA